MTLIAHLSDLHFGAIDQHAADALALEVTALRPDLAAISGDLTMRARRHEFAAARAFIDQLGAPVLAVPGNHDITPFRLIERMTDPYARWRAAIHADTEPDWSNSEVAVFGLNTARRLGMHFDWSRGRVTRARLEKLLARLDMSAPGKARIVVAHHPLLPPPTAPATTLAGGARRALAAFEAHGVRLVLAGHLHQGYARLASPTGGPLILQGATATSTRLRGEPNAYNQITIGPDGQARIVTRIWTNGAWSTQPVAVAA